MFMVQKSINDMLCSIPAKLIDQFKTFGVRPAKLSASNSASSRSFLNSIPRAKACSNSSHAAGKNSPVST